MQGTYLLLIRLDEQRNIDIGALGTVAFNKGWYVYVGSAMNGLDQRIRRHLREKKKTHWHIDYLLHHAAISEVFYQERLVKEECNLAQRFHEEFSSIRRFGCSDCSCISHLFTGPYTALMQMIESLDMKPYDSDAKS